MNRVGLNRSSTFYNSIKKRPSGDAPCRYAVEDQYGFTCLRNFDSPGVCKILKCPYGVKING